MKKIFQRFVFISLIFYSGFSYSQINYKTALLNHIWSLECQTIQSGGVVYQEKNNKITMTRIQANLSKDVNSRELVLNEIKPIGINQLIYSYTENNKSTSDTIEFNSLNYRLLERITDSTYIVKNGIHISSGMNTLYSSRCDDKSAVFTLVSKNVIRTPSENDIYLKVKLTPEQKQKLHTMCRLLQDAEIKIQNACSVAGDIDRCIQIQRSNQIENQINQASKLFNESFNWQTLLGVKMACSQSGYNVGYF
jgi:hypothetical protein